MSVSLILDMAASDRPDAELVKTSAHALTAPELSVAAAGAAAIVAERGCSSVVYVGVSHAAFPVALFGAARAAVPFAPLNYRSSDEQLASLIAKHPDALVVADERSAARLRGTPGLLTCDAFLAAAVARGAPPSDAAVDPETVALLLYTSGTTAEPKAAVIRHRHLTSYIFGSVAFGAAAGESALVCVPPYHIAGVANLLSNVYSGRRIVYLEDFDAHAWIETARRESITNAMLVPTMLARIVDQAGGRELDLPELRAISYGGARMPLPVIEQALRLLPNVEFTNAYGLTETSSTIALLTPEDHRIAAASDDPAIRQPLASVGRPLPSIEIEVRGADGRPVPAETPGVIAVRGEQVSGEYLGAPSEQSGGWFETSDIGFFDADGYLYITGRADDTIIRGGENIAPGEIEDALIGHPNVVECAVVGVPDDTWGQRIAAVVVKRESAELDEATVRDWVRSRLRGAKTPDVVEFRTSLPQTATGKVLRRVLAEELAGGLRSAVP